MLRWGLNGYSVTVPPIRRPYESEWRKHEVSTTTVTIELPETVFSALHVDPQGFTREMRIAAAVKSYELGNFSLVKGAEIAGLTRSAFISALSEAKVSPFQYTGEELQEELGHAD